ncbi:MAG: ABC transporter substrate-binding protein [Deltaproteobacteria bacterium]|nr:ABC transporter substrate-binding protein [Deltaproteobacteria bacterium]MBW2120299.1 ABC transporter substrate-binding protein [Deltaproteobacteria bacterium]
MKIRCSWVCVILAFVAVLVLTNSGYAAQRKLVIVGWGGAWEEGIKKAFADPFEKETGIRVIFTGPIDFGKMKAMVESGKVEWDVLQAGDFRILPAAKAGLLEPIDYSIVDKSVLFPGAAREYGCGGEYEAMVLGYRTDTYKDKTPKGWKDFWDVKRFPGPRSLYKGVFYTLEAALLADGVPPDKLYPLDEDRAFASLDRIKPHVTVWWRMGSQSQALLKDHEVDMISAWNGRVAKLIHRGDPVAISWEQALFVQSAWAVVKNAPHKKEAMEFINFAGRAKNQAVMAEHIYYGPTNPEALKYIPEKVARWMPSYPENFKKSIELSGRYWEKNRDRLTEKFEAWLMK